MKTTCLTIVAILLCLHSFASLPSIAGTRNVCTGFTTALSDATPGGVWSSSNPSVASVGTATGVVTGISSGVVSIIYTLGANSVAALVTVNVTPAVYAVTGGGSYCAGSGGVPVGMGNTETGVSYLLYYGTSVTGYVTGTGAPVSFGSLTVAGAYTVQAINAATGCAAAMSGSVSVAITPLLIPTVSITASAGTTVCPGTTDVFTAVSGNGGSAASYLWNVNGTNVAIGSSYNFIPANGDVVTVNMTADTTCTASEMATAAAAMTVLPYETPSASIIVDPGDTVCQYAHAHFAVTGLYGGTAPVYTWLVNGGNMGTGTAFAYIPNSGDVVTCQLSSNYLCRLATIVSSGMVNMTVTPLIVPEVGIVSNPGLSINQGITDSLTAIVTNGGADPTYQWEINGVPVFGATSATFTSGSFADYDSVTCLVTSSGYCEGITSYGWVYITVNKATGVAQIIDPAGKVQLFPNPAKSDIALKGMVGTTDENVTIRITDMLGHIICHETASAANGNINHHIALGSSVAAGTYILTLQSSAGIKTFHFVVEK